MLHLKEIGLFLNNFPLLFFLTELQESHEQYFSPAEDDGDPAHEQCMSGHPAAPSAGVSSGNKQRWVCSNCFLVETKTGQIV